MGNFTLSYRFTSYLCVVNREQYFSNFEIEFTSVWKTWNSLAMNTIKITHFKSAAVLVTASLLAACNSSTDDRSTLQNGTPLQTEAGFASLGLASQWNELALKAIRSGAAKPTITAYQMHALTTAMYDSLAMFSAVEIPYKLQPELRRPVVEHTLDNREAAVSQAAYQMLTYLFPDYEASTSEFLDFLHALGYVETTVANSTPEGIGYAAAQAMIAWGELDGSNSQNDFKEVTSIIYPDKYEPKNSPDPIDEIGVFGPDFDPNRWEPLRVPNGSVIDADMRPVVDSLNLDSFGDQQFLTPHWGAVVPFALTHGSELRPPAPPLHGSDDMYVDARGHMSTSEEAYVRQFTEVLEYSANLNDREKIIAEFWADGPRTESPPGHWNQLTHGVIKRDNLGLEESVKLYFAINAALHDAAVATWEAKRYYDYIRPASAIRWLFQGQIVNAWGGPNLGKQPILGETWSPYQSLTFVTPPFPEYVSGHSTFSRAAAEVLTKFTGSEQFFDGVSTTGQDIDGDGVEDLLGQYIAPAGSFLVENGPVQDVRLRWHTFIGAADEAAQSRLYGGIHIQDGDRRGRELGRVIGQRVYEKASRYFDGDTSLE